MKIVAISDTHGKHRQINPNDIPEGDVLIHCGDMTKHGQLHEVEDFLDWFKQFDHEHKIFIAGNHDLCMQHYEDTGDTRQQEKIKNMLQKYTFEHNIFYLHDEATIIDGKIFYGSPYNNTLPGWAFNSGKECNEDVWNKIIDDTDVLITHGPPHGINDIAPGYGHIGDEKLRNRLEELDDLKMHLYGHVHGTHGESDKKADSYNCSLLDDDYEFSDGPVVTKIDS